MPFVHIVNIFTSCHLDVGIVCKECAIVCNYCRRFIFIANAFADYVHIACGRFCGVFKRIHEFVYVFGYPDSVAFEYYHVIVYGIPVDFMRFA